MKPKLAIAIAAGVGLSLEMRKQLEDAGIEEFDVSSVLAAPSIPELPLDVICHEPYIKGRKRGKKGKRLKDWQ